MDKLKIVRIGLFTDSYFPRMDGIAVSVESFRVGLEELGHTVYVFCPKRPEPFIEPNDRIYRFFSLPSISYEQYRDTFPFTPKHIRLVSSLNLDIIHTFTQTQIGLFGTFMAHRKSIPLVTTCGADFDLAKDYKRFIIAPPIMLLGTTLATQKLLLGKELRRFLKPSFRLSRWLDRSTRIAAGFYADQCDITTVPSLKSYKDIAPYMKKRPIVLPCGTDLRLVPDASKALSIRKQYRFSDKTVYFVSASRLVREKRIDFLIKAYAKLSEKDKEKSRLVIIGDGPENDALRYLVEGLGISDKVIFIGRVEHNRVLEVVSACDIYVHASLRETQGLVLNEAAACGKPLLMIDREVNDILHEGENGLFAENTLTDYSQKMAKLLNDHELREKYGRKSRQFAKATDLKEAAKPLEAIYNSLIHN